MSDPIVIVGAGECGARTALALRQLGWDGSLTLVGAERHDPYERPPLSKDVLATDHTSRAPTICDGPTLTEAKIDFLRGVKVTAIDGAGHEVVLDGGSRLPYGQLLLATGARPRPLPVPGGEHALLLRDHDDAVALRAALAPGTRVGVVGGGFIGLEVAASATARGCDVTVVEVLPRLMARAVPEAVAEVMAERHRSAGVAIRCGVSVDRIERGDEGWRIVLADGDAVDCDLVIAGIGSVPETALAEAAGLGVDNGISVDATLRTSDTDIFAAGDCCSFPHGLYGGRRIRLESWRAALDQAAVAAGNLLGAEEPYLAVPWFWSDQHDLTLQIAGLDVPGTTEVCRHRADGVDVRFQLEDDGRLLSASAVGIGNSVAKDIRVAERLIAARATPDRPALADPAVNLKTLLSAS